MAKKIKAVQMASSDEGIEDEVNAGEAVAGEAPANKPTRDCWAEDVENELWRVTSYLKLFTDLPARTVVSVSQNGRSSLDIDAEAFGVVMEDLANRCTAIQARILELAK